MALANQYQPWLMNGITGSGKTEVYMRLMQQILQQSEAQVLVLVPEINLTPQLEARFRSRLPEYPLVSLHSNLSESERLHHWQLAQSGMAKIVIGTRLLMKSMMHPTSSRTVCATMHAMWRWYVASV